MNEFIRKPRNIIIPIVHEKHKRISIVSLKILKRAHAQKTTQMIHGVH